MATIYNQNNYQTTNWSGGKTTQIAISPAGADYKQQDFDWRISSATIEVEKSDFTPMLNYQRWLTLLEGEITISHNQNPSYEMVPFQVTEFDGNDKTNSVGTCVDFNLMIKKGFAKGKMECKTLAPNTVAAFDKEENIVVYLASGQGFLKQNDESFSIEKGMSVVSINKACDFKIEAITDMDIICITIF